MVWHEARPPVFPAATLATADPAAAHHRSAPHPRRCRRRGHSGPCLRLLAGLYKVPAATSPRVRRTTQSESSATLSALGRCPHNQAVNGASPSDLSNATARRNAWQESLLEGGGARLSPVLVAGRDQRGWWLARGGALGAVCPVR